MGRVVVFSGSLKAEGRLSKNGIRSRSPLSDVCFDIFIGVLLIYGAFVYVTPLLSIFVRLNSYVKTWLLIIIFTIKEKCLISLIKVKLSGQVAL
jgi:hypothetical protein